MTSSPSATPPGSTTKFVESLLSISVGSFCVATVNTKERAFVIARELGNKTIEIIIL
jgi:hypothetical protein